MNRVALSAGEQERGADIERAGNLEGSAVNLGVLAGDAEAKARTPDLRTREESARQKRSNTCWIWSSKFRGHGLEP